MCFRFVHLFPSLLSVDVPAHTRPSELHSSRFASRATTSARAFDAFALGFLTRDCAHDDDVTRDVDESKDDIARL